MRIVMGLAAIVMLGVATSGCVAVSAASTVASVATTAVGTTVDVGSSVVKGAAHTVTGSDSDN